ncbi:MAG: 5-formyltetrahydrofolate cyclo-ligase [Deltaproteobacteria bacterium]|nr:5-formyltetrahydrofolate cyclo-ligase [Deltaproteobacteria bacterium]
MNRSVIKERLRGEMIERRREMAFEEVYRVSERVQKMFLESEFFRSTRCFSLYSSFRNEVLTDEIFRSAVNGGKEVYYPRVVKGPVRHIEFFRVSRLNDLSPGSYEIPEPGKGEVKGDPGAFDLVVVPGVAFDRKGARLGYGKGYYDRALSSLRCAVVALAYGFQVIEEEIPVEAHDIRVSAIVTEEGIIRI